jgi:hypothetical protein
MTEDTKLLVAAGEIGALWTWDTDEQIKQAEQLLELSKPYLTTFNEKLTAEDVTPGLKKLAEEWVCRYHSNDPFIYLAEMKMTALEKDLSPGQAKGVLNCMRAEVNRETRTAAAKPNGEYVVRVGRREVKIKLEANDFEGGDPTEQIACYEGKKKPWVRFAFVHGGRFTVWKHYRDDENLAEALKLVLAA